MPAMPPGNEAPMTLNMTALKTPPRPERIQSEARTMPMIASAVTLPGLREATGT